MDVFFLTCVVPTQEGKSKSVKESVVKGASSQTHAKGLVLLGKEKSGCDPPSARSSAHSP